MPAVARQHELRRAAEGNLAELIALLSHADAMAFMDAADKVRLIGCESHAACCFLLVWALTLALMGVVPS